MAYHFLRRHPGDMTDPGLAGDIVRIVIAAFLLGGAILGAGGVGWLNATTPSKFRF